MVNKKLYPIVSFDYPEFEKHKEIMEILGVNNRAYYFHSIKCSDWYHKLIDKIFTAILQKEDLPIYRMGDGEYEFLYKMDAIQESINLSPFKRLTRSIKNLFTSHKSGISADGLETYSFSELKKISLNYFESLEYVASKGIISHAFHDSDNYARFYEPTSDIFNKHSLPINEDNYYHVYHFYAFLSSSYLTKLVDNRNILIFTSIDKSKQENCADFLYSHNARSVKFHLISSNKSMMDSIDLTTIPKEVELIFIAAGVGSLNILRELKDIKCVKIDIGTMLGAFIDHTRRFERPYMTTDNDFDLNKISFLNEGQKEKLKQSNF